MKTTVGNQQVHIAVQQYIQYTIYVVMWQQILYFKQNLLIHAVCVVFV